MIVAIDGPAGSGKSTIARRLASDLGFTYLDTGAMYRTVALAALEQGVDLDDADALAGVARACDIEFGRADDGAQTVLDGGRDVTRAIRTPEVDGAVSLVSRFAGVRDVCVARQRELAGCTDVVAEGRDIGTVVFPRADVKVFLTASAEARAHRRAVQNVERGLVSAEDVDEAAILAAILERDRIDSQRDVAPLVCAPDAVVVDSSDLGPDDVLQIIVGLVDAARENGGAR